jgi:hypothetical protein
MVLLAGGSLTAKQAVVWMITGDRAEARKVEKGQNTI